MQFLACYSMTSTEQRGHRGDVRTRVCGRKSNQSSYLVQGEGADTESGQFYGVQQGHLGHTIGFCAATGPILVTLNLGDRERKRDINVTFGQSFFFSPPVKRIMDVKGGLQKDVNLDGSDTRTSSKSSAGQAFTQRLQ